MKLFDAEPSPAYSKQLAELAGHLVTQKRFTTPYYAAEPPELEDWEICDRPEDGYKPKEAA